MQERKIAVVTGGAGAIGEATAAALADLGYRIILVDRDPAAEQVAASLAARTSCQAFIIDLVAEGAIATFARFVESELGRLDVLVNNAGIHPKREGRKVLLPEISRAEWDNVMTLNLTAPFLLYQVALPYMAQNKWGRIVNVASLAGRTLSNLAAGHYSASKAGLIGLTRVMAYESAQHGITANCVAPGPVLTALTTPLAEVRARVAAEIPLQRYGNAAEIAHAIKYLVSDDAGFTTGAVIDVTGGAFMP